MACGRIWLLQLAGSIHQGYFFHGDGCFHIRPYKQGVPQRVPQADEEHYKCEYSLRRKEAQGNKKYTTHAFFSLLNLSPENAPEAQFLHF